MEQNHHYPSSPRIGIVIPVYKHSVLVSEAITCVLQQDTSLPFVIILVNDGCRFIETDQVCRDFALAYPEKIIYLYRPNGGLSAARNTGIEFILNAWDSVEAIYLLDADNRISAHTLELSFQILASNPKIGWVYPTIDMFGKEEGTDFDYRGEYSTLRHLRFNTCEAGSMIRREVFDRGCRYDESMKLGFEDWEFWWQGIKAGYRGQHLPESGFQYRKRFESMLRDSERDGEGIKHYMKQKHKDLFTHRQILNLEQQEAPRYAIFLQDTGQILLTCDPTTHQSVLSISEFQDYYHRGRLMPIRYHRSYFLVFTSSKVLSILHHEKLIHWAFWQLETVLFENNFATFSVEGNLEEEAILVNKTSRVLDLKVGEGDHFIMTTTKIMDECVADSEGQWIQSLLTLNPIPTVFGLEVKLPQLQSTEIPSGGALYSLLSTFKILRRQFQKQGRSKPWDWHGNYLPHRSVMFKDARLALNCGAIYPKLTKDGEKHIGFILSILEFGGVEKVALNIAKAFCEGGWNVHLVIFGSRMQKLPKWGSMFGSISFYDEVSMSPWQGQLYMGTKSDGWSNEEQQLTAKGLLSWLDVAVNFHSATANNIMGLLRRSGVRTATSLHVHDLSPWHRPVGHSYLTLGYEHAYDYILPCSYAMADWCHSLGVPEEKVVVVPNAGGYPISETTLQEVLERRRGRGFTGKLRVLFIGRFDRQKGLDRLVGIVRKCEQLGLPIHWRLVGKNILQGENSKDELKEIQHLVEPPALTIEALNELYEWADVLLLPSYWEGLPLTILEAMRLGVVVCASDTGAVDEAVNHQETGIVLPNDRSFAEKAIAFLAELIANPLKLSQISEAAAKTGRRDWGEAIAEFKEKLEGLLVRNCN